MRDRIRWMIGRSIIMAGLIGLAIAYEQAAPDRLRILVLAGVGLIGLGVIRGWIVQSATRSWTFLADGVLLIGLETFSRYAINLALQGIYILLIVDAYRYLDKRHFLRVGVGISLLGMAKFAQQIALGTNFLLLSQTVFMAMVHVLVLTTLWFSRSYQEEKIKMEEANREIAQLSRERERTRLARELHDSMGHSLTALIMQMEIVKRTEGGLSEAGKAAMEEAAQTARQTLTEVRSVVDALKADAGEKSFQTMLQELIGAYQERTKIKVEMKGLERLPNILSKEALDLYRIVQESLTNTARHSQARRVEIDWNFDDNRLSLTIRDNGKGAVNFVSGNGLSGMQDRVDRLGGTIAFSGKDGFETRVKIPYREK